VDAGELPSQLFGWYLGLGLSLVLGAGLIVLAWMLLRRKNARGKTSPPDAVTAGVLCCTVLASFYHIGYDLLLLAWPFAALASLVWAAPRSAPLHRWLQLGLFALLAGNYASTFSVINALQATGVTLKLLMSLNGLALLALLGLYLYELARPATGPIPSAASAIGADRLAHRATSLSS
jgi:hypothetical protein